MRNVVTKILAPKFTSVEEAEEAYGLGVDSYSNYMADSFNKPSNPTTCTVTSPQLSADSLLTHLQTLTHSQTVDVANSTLNNLPTDTCLPIVQNIVQKFGSSDIIKLVSTLFKQLPEANQIHLLDKLFVDVAKPFNPSQTDFISHAITAMKNLQNSGKDNTLYKFARVLSVKRPDGQTLFPLDRMPWGLVQYQVDFFNCTHINQVSLNDRIYITNNKKILHSISVLFMTWPPCNLFVHTPILSGINILLQAQLLLFNV